MAVDLEYAPAEGFQRVAQTCPRQRVAPVAATLLARRQRPAILLEAVAVDDRGEVAEPVPRSDHHALPDHPLLGLAVAEHDERMDAETAHPRPEGDPESHGEALAERTRRRLETWQAGHIGMTLQPTVARIECRELLDREVPAQCQHHVEPDRRVALRQDESVTLGPVRLIWTDPQHAEVEGDQQVHGRQRAADVSRAAVRHRVDHEHPAPSGELPQVDLWTVSPEVRQRQRIGRT